MTDYFVKWYDTVAGQSNTEVYSSFATIYINLVITVIYKAMRKDFFSGFSDFAKDGTDFFPNSNLIRNKSGISVHPVISRKKYGTKSGTRMY